MANNNGNVNSNSSSLLKKYKDEPNKLTSHQKDKLIMEYAPLIKFIAQKIAVRLPSNIELDDLISSGVIGLMDAIEKYDETRDNKFKTYAEFRIRGAILDELRAQDWVPRSVRDKAKMLDRATLELESQLGRSANEEEVAGKLGMNMEEYFDLLNQVRPISVFVDRRRRDVFERRQKIDPQYLGRLQTQQPLDSTQYEVGQGRRGQSHRRVA